MEKQKVFSLSEVSLHSSKNDCWLIIHGKVYDVSKFLDEHPGGDKVLVDASADGDASDAFEDVGHGTAARSIMNNYSIGVLEGSDPFLVGGYPQSLRTKDKKASSPITSLLQFLRPLLPVILLGMIWYYFSSKGKMPQSP
ncbi:cytochrome b5-like protein [Cinnamomum micranthum f. kanehirae]|uniref:Cytochrome b5-like protein n=1 Tax=Cinnamomum micranthum f. kanehirae TaxID=337451 RepID=A0A443P8Q6_9MAGN|nr:cytochrome b5-like protein [Cinnamomum micranthum f. kanehirae]